MYSGKKLDYSSKKLFVFEGPQMPIKTKCLENSSGPGTIRPPYLPPEKSAYMSRNNRMGMEQQNGPKSEKEYLKAVYCHPDYLTYMQSTSREIPGWMQNKL